MAGLAAKIKSNIKKAGSNKQKFIYFPENQKIRVRFLDDMDDGQVILFHDNYTKGINVPCQETFGKECPYCGDDELRTREQYCWSVYDYENNEVKLLMFAANNCSPVPQLVALYENYGTLTDRDYIIISSGKAQNRTFTVMGGDKQKMRNSKAKALSKSAVNKIIQKAFPLDDDDEYEDEYANKKAKKQSSKNNEDWDDEDNDEEVNYSEMSVKELYKLCKEREIDVPTKKSEKYYIRQLMEWDEAQEDWDDDDEYEDDIESDDEWEDNDE